MNSIIFVCTSNTCRSPIASALAIKYLHDHDNQKYTVISRALTDAYEPEDSQASLYGIEVMKNDYNIDISYHRSKLLDDNDMNNAYKVIAVSQSHYNEIVRRYPNYVNKILTLAEDVTDPWHQPLAIYKQTAITLSRLINDTMIKIT